jgi:hypothetical protein
MEVDGQDPLAMESRITQQGLGWSRRCKEAI